MTHDPHKGGDGAVIVTRFKSVIGGSFEAGPWSFSPPEDGDYKFICIAGGGGGHQDGTAGEAGSVKHIGPVFLRKGQVVVFDIGCGGNAAQDGGDTTMVVLPL